MNIRTSAYLFAVVAGGFLALTGCSNPAADKPAAEVGEPIETSTSAVAESAAAAAAAETPDGAMATDGASEPTVATYTISPESKLTFIGSKVTGSHTGGFNTFSGTIVVAGDDLVAAKITVDIDMTSIFSDNDNLTTHLKSEDFFGVETYPTANFTSTSVSKTETGYSVTGNLMLHGVTKSITFPAEITSADGKVAAKAEFSINRTNWGITYPGKADDLIRDEVVIGFDLTASA